MTLIQQLSLTQLMLALFIYKANKKDPWTTKFVVPGFLTTIAAYNLGKSLAWWGYLLVRCIAATIWWLA